MIPRDPYSDGTWREQADLSDDWSRQRRADAERAKGISIAIGVVLGVVILIAALLILG